jgi:hypothetical protein
MSKQIDTINQYNNHTVSAELRDLEEAFSFKDQINVNLGCDHAL